MYIIIDFYNKLLKQTYMVSPCCFITYTASHLFCHITVHQQTYFTLFFCVIKQIKSIPIIWHTFKVKKC